MDRRLYMVLPICSFSSPHGCYRWYLSNEGAENALLAKIIISMRRRCRRCTPSQSPFITFHTVHLREVLDGSINIGIITDRLYCLARSNEETASSGTHDRRDPPR